MNGLFDTHCHLTSSQLSRDFDKVLIRALSVNVTSILVPGMDLQSSYDAINLCAIKDFDVFSSIGVHPNYANDFLENQIPNFVQLSSLQEVVAIGEIGLDYYRDFCSPEKQKVVLKKFLELSAMANKPVILHNRNSEQDLLVILKEWIKSLSVDSSIRKYPGVFHAYNGDEEILNFAMENNFKLGIGGPITFENAIKFQEIIKSIPLEMIILETDAPYLSPHPFRGKINEPERLTLIAQKLADLKRQNFESIVDVTTNNAKELFGIKR